MDIGLAIRTIRKQKQITIMQMCEGTGLSKGFISNVENNKTSPSIATLESIADYLEVPLPYLLLSPEQRMNVVRKDERKETTAGSGQIKVQHLTAKGAMRMSIVELPAGASTGVNKHAGEESHLILQGKIRAEQCEDVEILEAGDSFSWNAIVPHEVTNIGEEPAVVLIAVSKELDLDHLWDA
ncbi:XRE family transcriptional regulator [Paenibacillus sp. UMB7766-LJ446]|uniref:helix-turn-helix domain-containing protein n=1 Tax=Paenibacillus sp. UMB7766-LJ446 TaxID=3046313 RepID=UPI00254D604E|nr:XRE family transcriptional regulator [Paenibacillus sp. UMB7766-LJ446]MDK8190225.1 XRE family transcriptional regulator [Paenibacillus sp. UMB7766-LJ446]